MHTKESLTSWSCETHVGIYLAPVAKGAVGQFISVEKNFIVLIFEVKEGQDYQALTSEPEISFKNEFKGL